MLMTITIVPSVPPGILAGLASRSGRFVRVTPAPATPARGPRPQPLGVVLASATRGHYDLFAFLAARQIPLRPRRPVRQAVFMRRRSCRER
jgi:hypothetical protein